MSDSQSKGEVLDEIRKNAKGIIKNLKRIVESQPREWYLNQTNTGSRPLGPAALAKLLGATLPAVEGEDMTDVYEAMVVFVESDEGQAHGKDQLAIMRARAHKTSLEAKTLPSYALAYFIDFMVAKPGKAELFSKYHRKSQDLVNRIQRETDYRVSVALKGYMSVEIQGKTYALRIEEGRRFILKRDVEYETEMLAARTAAAARAAATSAPVTNIKSPTAAGASPGPDPKDPTFQASTESLLKKKP